MRLPVMIVAGVPPLAATGTTPGIPPVVLTTICCPDAVCSVVVVVEFDALSVEAATAVATFAVPTCVSFPVT
uniref:Putative secreted protein n=1 Tax=Anopheles marajoara TaxID=58244 RepID=A0A2M4CE01_9DIPT